MRPGSLGPHFAAMYDWLGANGVTEWLPDSPVIEIGVETIRYTAFVWPSDDQRGFNGNIVTTDDAALIEWRSVPLAVWPPPQVVAAATVAGAAMIDGTV